MEKFIKLTYFVNLSTKDATTNLGKIKKVISNTLSQEIGQKIKIKLEGKNPKLQLVTEIKITLPNDLSNEDIEILKNRIIEELAGYGVVPETQLPVPIVDIDFESLSGSVSTIIPYVPVTNPLGISNSEMVFEENTMGATSKTVLTAEIVTENRDKLLKVSTGINDINFVTTKWQINADMNDPWILWSMSNTEIIFDLKVNAINANVMLLTPITGGGEEFDITSQLIVGAWNTIKITYAPIMMMSYDIYVNDNWVGSNTIMPYDIQRIGIKITNTAMSNDFKVNNFKVYRA